MPTLGRRVLHDDRQMLAPTWVGRPMIRCFALLGWRRDRIQVVETHGPMPHEQLVPFVPFFAERARRLRQRR